jgi:hypothetical protein
MIYRAAFAVSFAVSSFILLLAQVDDADRAACHADAVKLCKHELAGGTTTVAGCLIANKDKLSPRCRAVFDAHGL